MDPYDLIVITKCRTSIYSSRINLRLDMPGQFTLNEEKRDGQVS